MAQHEARAPLASGAHPAQSCLSLGLANAQHAVVVAVTGAAAPNATWPNTKPKMTAENNTKWYVMLTSMSKYPIVTCIEYSATQYARDFGGAILWQLQNPGDWSLRRSDAKASMLAPMMNVAKNPSAMSAGVCSDHDLNSKATHGAFDPPPFRENPSINIVVGGISVLQYPVRVVDDVAGHVAAHAEQCPSSSPVHSAPLVWSMHCAVDEHSLGASRHDNQQ